ncbi:MAG: hypothetical protein ACJAV1_000153 [Paraglaciecola sp.]|jgi:hypothetical protein
MINAYVEVRNSSMLHYVKLVSNSLLFLAFQNIDVHLNVYLIIKKQVDTNDPHHLHVVNKYITG